MSIVQSEEWAVKADQRVILEGLLGEDPFVMENWTNLRTEAVPNLRTEAVF